MSNIGPTRQNTKVGLFGSDGVSNFSNEAFAEASLERETEDLSPTSETGDKIREVYLKSESNNQLPEKNPALATINADAIYDADSLTSYVAFQHAAQKREVSADDSSAIAEDSKVGRQIISVASNSEMISTQNNSPLTSVPWGEFFTNLGKGIIGWDFFKGLVTDPGGTFKAVAPIALIPAGLALFGIPLATIGTGLLLAAGAMGLWRLAESSVTLGKYAFGYARPEDVVKAGTGFGEAITTVFPAAVALKYLKFAKPLSEAKVLNGVGALTEERVIASEAKALLTGEKIAGGAQEIKVIASLDRKITATNNHLTLADECLGYISKCKTKDEIIGAWREFQDIRFEAKRYMDALKEELRINKGAYSKQVTQRVSEYESAFESMTGTALKTAVDTLKRKGIKSSGEAKMLLEEERIGPISFNSDIHADSSGNRFHPAIDGAISPLPGGEQFKSYNKMKRTYDLRTTDTAALMSEPVRLLKEIKQSKNLAFRYGNEALAAETPKEIYDAWYGFKAHQREVKKFKAKFDQDKVLSNSVEGKGFAREIEEDIRFLDETKKELYTQLRQKLAKHDIFNRNDIKETRSLAKK